MTASWRSSGADILLGGLGADTLTGGGANDILRYATVNDGGVAAADIDIIPFPATLSLDLKNC